MVRWGGTLARAGIGAPLERLGRGLAEGTLHRYTRPAQHTDDSGNKLNDLLQLQDLTRNGAQNELVLER